MEEWSGPGGQVGPAQEVPPASPPFLGKLHPSFRRLRPPRATGGYRPRAVYVLAGVNLAVSAALSLLGKKEFVRISEIFYHDPLAVWRGEYWRLLTATFLHGGPELPVLCLHLGLNLLLCILVGRLVERWIGPWRFAASYLFCGLCAQLAFQAASGVEPGVGASGAIYGILGVFLVGRLGRAGPGGAGWSRPLALFASSVVPLIYLEQACGQVLFREAHMPLQVAASAHLGGYLCGLFLGFRLFTTPAPAGRGRRLALAGLGGSCVVLLGTYALAWPYWNWGWYYLRGTQALAEGREAAAEDLFRRARELGGDEAAVAVLRLDLDTGRVDRALERWLAGPPRDLEARVDAGYLCYDALAALDRVEEAQALLDRLVELADEALRHDRSPRHLNQAAWFRALRQVDLKTALEYAREATARAPGDGGFVNTLGWVQFQAGDHERGLLNLERAARMQRRPSFYLYVALAFFHTGKLEEAREFAVKTRKAGTALLERHEKHLLELLEESLASG